MGVSLSLVAVKNTEAGVAATIMAIVPVFVIPLSILIFKEKVSFRAVASAIIAVAGVGLLFLSETERSAARGQYPVPPHKGQVTSRPQSRA
jgi:drug/metabolite transporter (DMT)-like permease